MAVCRCSPIFARLGRRADEAARRAFGPLYVVVSAAFKSRLAWAWCVVIVLSQTKMAADAANALFGWFFGGGGGGDGVLRLVLQKGYHVLLYGTFGCLLTLPPDWRSVRTCLAWSAAVGVAGESLQLLVDGRSPRVSDAVLNVSAAILAVWLMRRLQAEIGERRAASP